MTEELTKNQRIFNYIVAKRKIFLFATVLVAISVFSFIILQIIEDEKNKKAQVVGEEIALAYDEYLDAKEQKDVKPKQFTKRTSELKELLEKYDGKYSTLYGGYKWAFVQAALLQEDEDVLGAAELLAECGKTNNHPLATLMLLDASAKYENLADLEEVDVEDLENDNIENAKELLQFVIDKKKDSSFYSKAVFNLGRIYETQAELELARETYALIAEEDSTDSFVSLAQTRIITLDIPLQEEIDEYAE